MTDSSRRFDALAARELPMSEDLLRRLREAGL